MTYGKFGQRPRVLVTGAAHGVGRTFARAAALFDVELILADFDGRLLADLADELSAHGMFCDPHSLASVEIFKAQYRQKFDSLHVLVNAAELGHERILSTIRMTAACLPLIRQTEGPRAILNIADGQSPASPTPFRYASSPEAMACYSAHLERAFKGTSLSVATIVSSDDDEVDAVCDTIETTMDRIVRGHATPVSIISDFAAPTPQYLRHDDPRPGLNDQSLPLGKCR